MFKILKILKKQSKDVILIMFLLIVNTVASLALPAIMSSIVNVGINGGDMDYIIKYSLVMLAIATAGFVAYIGAGKIGARIVSIFSTELSGKIFKKSLSLSYTEFSDIGASALLTRSTEDIYMIREMVMSLIGTVAMVPTLLIGGLILSFKEDVMLSLVLFALIPVLLILVRVVGKRIVPRWEVADKFIDDQNQIVRERLNGIRVIRAYNKEPYEHARLTKSTDDMAENIIKANTMSGLLNPISMLVLNVATVLIAYIGAVRLQLNGTITAGSIIAVIQYVGLVMSALGEVFFLLVFLPKIRVSCNRMNEVLELPEKEEPNDDLNVEIKGNIEFKDVSFTYNGADEPAISGINLNIAAGQTAAFIGGTGAGKSTVLDLLLKFYNNTEGKIVVDGMNLSDISTKRIRDSISVAMQKSVVLKGTMRHNITMGKPDATEAELESAAETAQLLNYIKSLPDGFEHMLEQNGTNISGGQKQRVAIARAVIKDAPVYVFDDSFSALDFLIESKLRRSLNERLKGKTQIIITQRVATAMSADVIYVFDKGKIVGNGNHRELMQSCPVYKEIYDSQIGGDLNEK